MTEADKERAVWKIKACLARADEERNANEHERATALRQANALMEQYSISIMELGDTDDLGPMGDDKVSIGAKPWKANVLNAVSRLYGCRVLYGRGIAYVYGRQHYRHVVADMAMYVINSIDKEAKTKDGDKSYKASFRNGAAQGVYKQVEGILKERAKAHDGVSESKALVLVDHFKNEMEATNKFIFETIGKTGTRQGTKSNSRAGFNDGKAYGESISLNDQLGGTKTAIRRLK